MLLLAPGLLAAQAAAPFVGRDSVRAIADSSFRAGSFHRFLFGNHYRQLWDEPIRAPVLDLGTFDGGLTPDKLGGGQQTKSLQLKSAAGRTWVFRTVRKDARVILPKTMRTGFAAAIVNDQISHSNPGGALTVPPMLEALGVLHATPQLAVMPDDPRLGKFRKEFVGELGALEEFPDDGPNGTAGFAGSKKIASSGDLRARLAADPDEQVDARKFLTARYLDLLINDWDRHKDQWKWARFDHGDGHIWEPIPRDRDQAYIWFDGAFPTLGRFGAPKLIGFDEKYPNLNGLTLNGRELDRALLVGLSWPTWDSIATFVRTQLTDSLIDAAVGLMPPEYERLSGAHTRAALKARRDGLNTEARRFYELLARTVDIHATDVPEVAVVERDTSGAVRVRLFDARHPDRMPIASRTPYFDRTFLPKETEEARVYLHGGADNAIVRGAAERSMKVRVIGGKGDNRLVDSSTVELDHSATSFYDNGKGPHDFTYGADTLFNRRPQLVRDGDTVPPPPDFNARMAPEIVFHYYTDQGLIFGGGITGMHYAFRTWPYWYQVSVHAEHGTGPEDTRVTALGTVYRESHGDHLIFWARASGLELTRYYGQGNNTVRVDDGKFGRVEHSQYRFETMFAVPFGRGSFRVGPALTFARTRNDSLSFAGSTHPYGSGDFGEVGLRAYVEYDTRDNSGAPRRGIHFLGGASIFPAIWEVDHTFGQVQGELATYIGVDAPLQPVLALRVGGKKVWGEFPFFESAFIGGYQTLRGYDQQRFAGNAAAWGNAELRLRLTSFRLLIPGSLGIHGMADAGRVWAAGQSSRTWHLTGGGGFWFNFEGPITTMSVTVAHSDERRSAVYVLAGFGF